MSICCIFPQNYIGYIGIIGLVLPQQHWYRKKASKYRDIAEFKKGILPLSAKEQHKKLDKLYEPHSYQDKDDVETLINAIAKLFNGSHKQN